MALMLARRITLSLSLVAAIVLAGWVAGVGRRAAGWSFAPPPPFSNLPPLPADRRHRLLIPRTRRDSQHGFRYCR